MNKLPKPHVLFAGVGALLLLLSLIVPKKFVDLHVYDTYFVFTFSLFIFYLSVIFIMVSIPYYLTRKNNIPNKLIGLHTLLTIISVGFLSWFIYQASKAYSTGFSEWKSFETNNALTSLTILLLLLIQIVFISIILFKFTKRRNNSR